MNGKEFARLSGTYNTAYIGTWELLSQSASTLTSVIKLRGYFYYGGGTQVTSSGTHNFLLDGTNIKTGSSYSYTNGYHKLGEKTITVKHNEDGSFPSRSVSLSASGYTHMNGSTSGTITDVPNIEISEEPIEIICRVNTYFKENNKWNKKLVYLKDSGSFKLVREFYKELGVWK